MDFSDPKHDRRKTDSCDLAEVIIKIYEVQSQNTVRLEKMDSRLTELVAAFPEGDTRGHRLYHDALIKKEEQRKEAWENIKTKTLGGLMLLAITSSAGWVITHIKDLIAITHVH